LGGAIAERLRDLDAIIGAAATDWRAQAEALGPRLDEMSADRDRLWSEVRHWHAEAEAAARQLEATERERVALQAEAAQQAANVQEVERRLGLMAADRDRLWQETQSWFRRTREMESSLLWRIAERIRSVPGYGLARSAARATLRLGTKPRDEAHPRDPEPRGNESDAVQTEAAVSTPGMAQDSTHRSRGTAEDRAWIARLGAARPGAVAVLHPDWRGVRSCLENLLSHRLYVRDDLDPARADEIAAMVAEAECPRLLFGGLPFTYRYLVRSVRKRSPKTQIFVLWLGSFLQSNEDYGWQAFKQVDQLCREGVVTKWGFGKVGMAEIVARAGVPTGFIMSYVRQVPTSPSVPAPGGPNLGIWALESIWRKNPYAMLAAASLIPGARVMGTGGDERVRDFIRYFKMESELRTAPLPQEAMPAALGRAHVNLYVTLSECAPMLPLESLAAGAPCLIGPTSHFFEDCPYLHSRLVVPSPDRARVIADYIGHALAEREQIISAYREYAPRYNARAEESLRAFLAVGPDVTL
jgi:hypothetical protein